MTIEKSVIRVKVVKVKEETAEYETHVSSPQCTHDFCVAAIYKDGDPVQEQFWVIALNVKNKVVSTTLISQGSMTECPILPADIFRLAIIEGAAAIILVHNHPSGDPAPSAEDKLLTSRAYKAGKLLGIKVLDHIIYGSSSKFYSFAGCGAIK